MATRKITVGKLIEMLQHRDPGRLVVMACDAEGNRYALMEGIDDAAFAEESRGRGEVGLEELTEELEEAGYCEDDVVEGKPCVVLYPC